MLPASASSAPWLRAMIVNLNMIVATRIMPRSRSQRLPSPLWCVQIMTNMWKPSVLIVVELCAIYVPLSTHEDHTIKDLCSDEERTDELDQLFADHIDSADQQLARLITIQDDFNIRMDRAGNKLNKHHEDVIKQLKQQHKSFRAQLQQRRDKVNQNLEQSKDLIHQGNDCVNNLKRQSASWRRPIPGIPAASITDKHDLIEVIKQQLPSTDVPSEEPRRVIFLPSNLVSLGNIVEEELKPTTQLQRVILDVHTTWRERVTLKANTMQKDGTKPKKGFPVAKKNTEPNLTGNLITLKYPHVKEHTTIHHIPSKHLR